MTLILPTTMQPFGDEHLVAMGLGLSSAHRCGKTSLTKKLSELNGFPFVGSSASAIAEEMGVTADAGAMSFVKRLEFQERVLGAMTDAYDAQSGKIFVSDRTPLDLAAYLMIEWHPHFSNADFDAWVLDYITRCFDVTNRYFFQVTVLQPGIPYLAAAGKPKENPLYQELLNTVITGLLYDERLKSCAQLIDRDVIDFAERVRLVTHDYSTNAMEYQKDIMRECRPQ